MRILKLSEVPAPAYLLLCLLLGGASAGGAPANALLQILAVIALAGFALRRRPGEELFASRTLVWLLMATAGLVLYQLIPLPAGIWSNLPGRGDIAAGYRLLDMPLPTLSLSLDADRTIAAGLGLLPPLAMVLLTINASGRSRLACFVTVAAVTSLSTLVGGLQLSGGPDSLFYFYDVTNDTSAVGFFANSNHLATMFLATLPCVAALAAQDEKSRRRAAAGRRWGLLGLLLFLCFGLLLNHSLAGLIMLVPVLLACFAVWRYALVKTTPRWITLAGMGVVAILLAFALLGPLGGRFQEKTLSLHDPVTRRTTNMLTFEAAVDHLPFGTGLGTFVPVYAGYEKPETISTTYVNHAHDDYAELLLETGIPGAALLAAWLLWYARRSRTVWSSEASAGVLARAGTVIIGVVLVHSLVDYPARTAAIEAIVGLAVGLVAVPAPRKAASAATAARGRHARAD